VITVTEVDIRKYLTKWREELLNINRRNNLINFKSYKASTLEIEEPDLQTVFEKLAKNNSWQFYQPPQNPEDNQDISFEEWKESWPNRRKNELVSKRNDPKILQRVLRNLFSRSKQDNMDRGIWTLYISFGMLNWQESSTDIISSLNSPLVLMPVKIERLNPRSPYEMRLYEDEIIINPPLRIKLQNEFGLLLPDGDDLEDMGVLDLLKSISDAIKKQVSWRVVKRVIIGRFSFLKETIYRDLIDNEDRIMEHTIIRALTKDSEAVESLQFDLIDKDELDDIEPPEELHSVMDADSSQIQCIVAARNGESFVMDGPPGTGKSQTIANMIAELLVYEKTVLFVSEKAAALDIVRNRLLDAGLGEYLLELHSHKTTRKEFAKDLGKTLDNRPKPPTGVSLQQLEKLQDKRRKLSQYAYAMNEIQKPLYKSIHDVIGQICSAQHLMDAPIPSTIGYELTAKTFNQIIEDSGKLARSWKPVEEGDEFLWRGYKLAEFNENERFYIEQALSSCLETVATINQYKNSIAQELDFPTPDDMPSLLRFNDLLKLLEDKFEIPPFWLTGINFDDIEREYKKLKNICTRLKSYHTKFSKIYGERWQEIDQNGYDVLASNMRSLNNAIPPLYVGDKDSLQSLEKKQAILAELINLIDTIHDKQKNLLASIELNQDLCLLDLEKVVNLLLCMESHSRPLMEWFEPGGPALVNAAIEELEPLYEDFIQAMETLKYSYKEDILGLDLGDLAPRFILLDKSFFKGLRPAWWKARKTILQYAHTTNDEIDLTATVAQALVTKQRRKNFEDALTKHSELLGLSINLNEFDVDRLKKAHSILLKAFHLSSLGYNLKKVAQIISVNTKQDFNLFQDIKMLKHSLDDFLTQLNSLFDDPGSIHSRNAKVLDKWLKYLGSIIAKIINVMKDVLAISPNRFDVLTLKKGLKALYECSRLEEELQTAFKEAQTMFATFWDGLETDFDLLEKAMNWTKDVRLKIGTTLDIEKSITLLKSAIDPAPLNFEIVKWKTGLDKLEQWFKRKRAKELRRDIESSLLEGKNILSDLKASIADIDVFLDFRKAFKSLKANGLGETLDHLIEKKAKRNDIRRIIERVVYQAWFASLIKLYCEGLSIFRYDELNELANEFRKLDKEVVRGHVGKIISKCNEKRPLMNVGAVGVIRQEASKKRRHMPIRKLFSHAGPVIMALKPCVMMSPLSVSSFLPPDIDFDVVIFDEASQVRPSDAINCIYRGEQLIVAGDEKQLPPTSFFERVRDSDEEWDEKEAADFESILDVCKAAGLKALSLRWHYRSQHESLITYSNMSFYDGNLITFPSPLEKSELYGLEHIKVDGEYHPGKNARNNPKEAIEVIKRVFYHIDKSPESTIGVVTFSQAQADCIENELERSRRKHPEYDGWFLKHDINRLSTFFIKNLETVQGDERDIVIFSVGYGPDVTGKLRLQMGPLTRPGGQRRLNVAITRARKRVEIVSSFFPEQMRTAKSAGPRHLKRYIEFARKGTNVFEDNDNVSQGEIESPFEMEVFNTLLEWGYDVVPQVGAAHYRIDMAVRHPDQLGEFVLGIECDGAMYHSSRVARDRDRLRQEVLERLGWKLHRIWGPTWYRDRSKAEERLEHAIKKAIDTHGERFVVEEEYTPVIIETEEVDMSDTPPWASPYRYSHMHEVPWSYYEFTSPFSRSTIKKQIRHIVNIEGPVHENLVLERLKPVWRFKRATAPKRRIFKLCVEDLIIERAIWQDNEGFLWQGYDVKVNVRIPTQDDPNTFRGIMYIPEEEIEEAMKLLLDEAKLIPIDELISETSRLFGWKRTGPEINQKLSKIFSRLVRKNEIELSDA